VAKGVQPGILDWLTHEDFQVVSEVMIAEKFGWTLDYVRDLGSVDFDLIMTVISGKNKAQSSKK
jgi:hypothetical protein